MIAARRSILAALVLVATACRQPPVAGAPASTRPRPVLTAEDARRAADAYIAGWGGDDTHHFMSVDENAEEFFVHYARELACPRSEPPAAAPAASPDGSRVFTAVVDICPTGSPGGATVRVRKADGRAEGVGSE